MAVTPRWRSSQSERKLSVFLSPAVSFGLHLHPCLQWPTSFTFLFKSRALKNHHRPRSQSRTCCFLSSFTSLRIPSLFYIIRSFIIMVLLKIFFLNRRESSHTSQRARTTAWFSRFARFARFARDTGGTVFARGGYNVRHTEEHRRRWPTYT